MRKLVASLTGVAAGRTAGVRSSPATISMPANNIEAGPRQGVHHLPRPYVCKELSKRQVRRNEMNISLARTCRNIPNHACSVFACHALCCVSTCHSVCMPPPCQSAKIYTSGPYFPPCKMTMLKNCRLCSQLEDKLDEFKEGALTESAHQLAAYVVGAWEHANISLCTSGGLCVVHACLLHAVHPCLLLPS